MTMKTIKVAEATERQLDWLVARIEGDELPKSGGKGWTTAATGRAVGQFWSAAGINRGQKMTDRTHPDSGRATGAAHIIRYALELGLLWVNGDGRDKVREALDALDTLEAQLEAIGAGGVSGPLMGRASPPTAQAEGWTKLPGQLPEPEGRVTAPGGGVVAAGRFMDEAAERRSAQEGYENRIKRVSERNPHDEGMYSLGWWDRAWKAAAPTPAAQAADSVLENAETALRKVLDVVQRYLPPDGPSIQDAMSEIIAIVDPWPLGPLEKS